MPDDRQTARRQAVGRRVRELRESLGLTQQQLAERSGLSRSYVALVEGGDRNVTNDALWALADAFGVNPAAFYIGLER